MFAQDEKTLRWIYIGCVSQFLITFVYINVTSQPIDKTDMILIGLSAVIGILFAGSERRDYYQWKEENDRKKQYTDLDETISKLKQPDNHKNIQGS
jgi:hypothetical protein